MTEGLLTELWAQDEPPARDPAFVLAAMEKVERRRFLMGVLALAPVAAIASLLLWALGPVIADASAAFRFDAASIGSLAAAVVMALFLWSWVSGRLQPFEA